MTLKEQILEDIVRQYKETSWPFMYKAEYIRKFGEEAREALIELSKEGVIRPTDGQSGTIIAYIPGELEMDKAINDDLERLAKNRNLLHRKYGKLL